MNKPGWGSWWCRTQLWRQSRVWRRQSVLRRGCSQSSGLRVTAPRGWLFLKQSKIDRDCKTRFMDVDAVCKVITIRKIDYYKIIQTLSRCLIRTWEKTLIDVSNLFLFWLKSVNAEGTVPRRLAPRLHRVRSRTQNRRRESHFATELLPPPQQNWLKVLIHFNEAIFQRHKLWRQWSLDPGSIC